MLPIRSVAPRSYHRRCIVVIRSTVESTVLNVLSIDGGAAALPALASQSVCLPIRRRYRHVLSHGGLDTHAGGRRPGLVLFF
jgi:hypothetical protein